MSEQKILATENNQNSLPQSFKKQAKLAWDIPCLELFGSVEALTLGGPPGTGDSGAGSLTQSPNFS